MANYLKQNGWIRDGLILTDLKVRNKKKILDKLSKKTYKPHTKYQEYARMNIKTSSPIDSDEILSVIKRLEGETNIYSFGHNNFYTITRYNRSRLYALAVYTLAQEIKMTLQ